MEKKHLQYLFVGLVIILSLTSILLISILPYIKGIPGLDVTVAEERIYSSPDTPVVIECFLDVSNVNSNNEMVTKFNTNTTIDGELTAHVSNSIGYVDYIAVTLNPTIANIGETIEVIITIKSGFFSQTETIYVIVT